MHCDPCSVDPQQSVVACRAYVCHTSRCASLCFSAAGSGLIDTAELDNVMSQLGMELPEEHLTRLKASVSRHYLRCL